MILLYEEGFVRREEVSGGIEEKNLNEEIVRVNIVFINVL